MSPKTSCVAILTTKCFFPKEFILVYFWLIINVILYILYLIKCILFYIAKHIRYHFIYLEPGHDLNVWSSTLQNKTEMPTKTRCHLSVPGMYMWGLKISSITLWPTTSAEVFVVALAQLRPVGWIDVGICFSLPKTHPADTAPLRVRRCFFKFLSLGSWNVVFVGFWKNPNF